VKFPLVQKFVEEVVTLRRVAAFARVRAAAYSREQAEAFERVRAVAF
jgi:hypothetical protein